MHQFHDVSAIAHSLSLHAPLTNIICHTRQKTMLTIIERNYCIKLIKTFQELQS